MMELQKKKGNDNIFFHYFNCILAIKIKDLFSYNDKIKYLFYYTFLFIFFLVFTSSSSFMNCKTLGHSGLDFIGKDYEGSH